MDNLKLDIFFSNLKSTLGPSYFDFITEMDIKPNQLYSNISLSQINRLTNRLNVTIDSIFQDKVDFEVLRNQYQGKANLPSRYQGAEFSSRFTSMYMVNFITKNFGSDAAKFIKQRFQLKDSHFENVTDKNNILLPSDICEYINEFHGMEALEKMGESSLALFAESGICQNLKKLPKMSNFFDSFFNDFLPGNIEKNYQWSIYREGSSFIEVQGSVNGEVTACLGENNVITPSLENLRKGFLKSVPKLYADYSVDINMLKRLSAGDSYDLYRIEFFRVNKIPAFLH